MPNHLVLHICCIIFHYQQEVGLFRAGLFDEDLGVGPVKYPPVSEESELQQRLISIGVRPVYLPQAVVRHSVKKECYTFEWVSNRHFRHGTTDYIIWRKLGPTVAFTPQNWRGYEVLGTLWEAVVSTLSSRLSPLYYSFR
jgi:hypothetical protein